MAPTNPITLLAVSHLKKPRLERVFSHLHEGNTLFIEISGAGLRAVMKKMPGTSPI